MTLASQEIADITARLYREMLESGAMDGEKGYENLRWQMNEWTRTQLYFALRLHLHYENIADGHPRFRGIEVEELPSLPDGVIRLLVFRQAK